MRWTARFISSKEPEQQLDELLDPQVEEAYHAFLDVLAQVPGAALRQEIDDVVSHYGLLRGQLGFKAGLNAALDPRPWLLRPEAERLAEQEAEQGADEIHIVIDPTGYRPKAPYEADVV